MPALYQILHSSGNPQIQQLAAVELRKRVGQGKTKFWAKTQTAMKTEIKTGLLQMLAAGGASPPLVRHAISRLIAAIAKRELPEKWVDWTSSVLFFILLTSHALTANGLNSLAGYGVPPQMPTLPFERCVWVRFHSQKNVAKNYGLVPYRSAYTLSTASLILSSLKTSPLNCLNY